MAFLGDHVPGTIIVVSYAVVYYEIRKLIKPRPQTAGILSLMYVLTSERCLNLALLTLSSFKLHIETRPRYLNTNGFKSSSLAFRDPDGSAFSCKPQILALLLIFRQITRRQDSASRQAQAGEDFWSRNRRCTTEHRGRDWSSHWRTSGKQQHRCSVSGQRTEDRGRTIIDLWNRRKEWGRVTWCSRSSPCCVGKRRRWQEDRIPQTGINKGRWRKVARTWTA